MSYPQPQQVFIAPSKSNIVAYLLWFFFGIIGGHKLYLKQPIQFAIYLVLGIIAITTFWIPFIGAILCAPIAIMLFIDLFIIPGRVEAINRGSK